jgi:2-polyprenyl-3-methyl-5-hydroxy-6-metoxy-1,4-benzoquinol methylase
MKPQDVLGDYYKKCLEEHGDNHLGVNWIKKEDVFLRNEAIKNIIDIGFPMLEVLDIGCGTGSLLEHFIKENFYDVCHYHGIDINSKAIELCKSKFIDSNIHSNFTSGDVLDDSFEIPLTDFAVMNGVLTVKHTLSHKEMWEYTEQLLSKVFQNVNCGMIFNFMTKQVTTEERDDLFHVGFDEIATFITNNLSRKFSIHHDYLDWEYLICVQK